MGRKPIGKVAMTDAERQRRSRERLPAEITLEDVVVDFNAALPNAVARIWQKLGSPATWTPEGALFASTAVHMLMDQAASWATLSAHEGGYSEEEFVKLARDAYRKHLHRNSDDDA